MDIFPLLWKILKLKQIVEDNHSLKLKNMGSLRSLYIVDKKLKNTTKNAKSSLGLFKKDLKKVQKSYERICSVILNSNIRNQ